MQKKITKLKKKLNFNSIASKSATNTPQEFHINKPEKQFLSEKRAVH